MTLKNEVQKMNKKELIQKVAYLNDNINKKIRKFRKEGLGDFIEDKLNRATASFDARPGIDITMKSGFLTKSKKMLEKLGENQLNLLYTKLQQVQKNEQYGTVKRFRETERKNFDKSASTMKSLIGEEKFNALKGDMSTVDFMREFIKRKKEMTEKRGRTYDSNQILMEMALEIGDLDAEEQQDMMRAIAKIERSRDLMARNTVKMEGRRKNGNR